MAKNQELADFEQVVEKIIFNDDELGQLKIAIKNFTEGKTSAKEFKRLLLHCRGRMVEEITDFGFFFIERRNKKLKETLIITQQSFSPTQVDSQLNEDLRVRNELLETVADRINQLISRFNNKNSKED